MCAKRAVRLREPWEVRVSQQGDILQGLGESESQRASWRRVGKHTTHAN